MNNKSLEIKLLKLALSFYLSLGLIALCLIIILPLMLLVPLVTYVYVYLIMKIFISVYHKFKEMNRNEYDIPLIEQEAPDIYRIIDDLKVKLNIKKHVIVVIRTGETWISYNGLLNIGNKICIRLSNNDLAVLSVDELKALITIQLSHAEYVEKGIDGFIFNSIERMSGLHDVVNNMKANFLKPILQKYIEKKLNHTILYYLQYRKPLEEFADSTAIRICDENSYNSMTLKTHIANFMGRNVFVREHHQQFNNGNDYWKWLRKQLTPCDEHEENTVREWLLYTSVTSVYYAYQVLSDRIRMALTDNNDLHYSDTPAYGLLINPGDVISHLLEKTDEVIMKKEKVSSSEILESDFNVYGTGATSGVKLLGAALIGISIILTCVVIYSLLVWTKQYSEIEFMSTSDIWSEFVTAIVLAGVGYLLYKVGTREYIQIPVPVIDLWLNNTNERNTDIINDLSGEIEKNAPGSDRIRYFMDISKNALIKCNYAQAFAASQLLLMHSPSNIEALTINTIAMSHYGIDNLDINMNKIIKNSRYGLSFRWSIAWIGINIGNFDYAEANLLELINKKTVNPNIYAYLGYVQYNKSKYHEAEENLSKAMANGCSTFACQMLYADTLVQLGRAKDALELLNSIDASNDDYRMIRYRILNADLCIGNTHNISIADELISKYPEANTYINIADSYRNSNKFDEAEHYYKKAYEMFEAPNALIGLARLERKRFRYAKSKEYLYQAMETLRKDNSELNDKLVNLNIVLSELLSITKPIEGCCLWTVDCMTSNSTLFQNQRITVFAMDKYDAEKYIKSILNRLHPESEYMEYQFANWMPLDDTKQLRSPGVINWQIINMESNI
ncbi:MAG: tetratricopeptide repeat protein [Armatimonadota bacterium]